MWYVVEILFAKEPEADQGMITCETCNVLFEAPSALDACGKAKSWGKNYEKEGDFTLVGIRHLWSLDDQPGDGVEIGGSFHEERKSWEKRHELIPDLNEIPAIKFENNPDKPICELASEESLQRIRQVLGENNSE